MKNSFVRNAKNWVGAHLPDKVRRGINAAALLGGAARVEKEGRPELAKRIRKGAKKIWTGERNITPPSKRNTVQENRLLTFKEYIEERNETH